MDKNASNRPNSCICLCKKEILIKKILLHSKSCREYQLAYGTLPGSILNNITNSSNESIQLLYHILKNAKMFCTQKIKKESKDPSPKNPYLLIH